jgi:hypothetical protein
MKFKLHSSGVITTYRERRNPEPIMSLGAPMTPEMWVILHTTRVKLLDALITTRISKKGLIPFYQSIE